MKVFLRRLRGIIGMGLTWGAGLGVVGSAIGLLGFLTGDGFVTGLALTGAFIGFVAGGGFGIVLSLTGGRRGLRGVRRWKRKRCLSACVVEASATCLVCGPGPPDSQCAADARG